MGLCCLLPGQGLHLTQDMDSTFPPCLGNRKLAGQHPAISGHSPCWLSRQEPRLPDNRVQGLWLSVGAAEAPREAGWTLRAHHSVNKVGYTHRYQGWGPQRHLGRCTLTSSGSGTEAARPDTHSEPRTKLTLCFLTAESVL